MPYVPPQSLQTLLEKHKKIPSLVQQLTSSTSKPVDKRISRFIEKLHKHKNSITGRLNSINSYSDGLTVEEARLKTLLNNMLKEVEQYIEKTQTHVDQQKSDHKDSVRYDNDVISTTHSPLRGKND